MFYALLIVVAAVACRMFVGRTHSEDTAFRPVFAYRGQRRV